MEGITRLNGYIAISFFALFVAIGLVYGYMKELKKMK